MKLCNKAFLFMLAIILIFGLSSCKRHVENQEYTIEYNSKTYEGKYTGEFEHNMPVDEGKFVFGNEGDANYFIYDGHWEAGKIKGKGELITNNYTISYMGTNTSGSYNGPVLDGFPHGEGTFSAEDEDKGRFVYSGEWKYGLYDGRGKMVFDDEYLPIYEGKYEKGSYLPTVAEFVRMIGTLKGLTPYTVSSKVFEFIDHNSMALVEHDLEALNEHITDDFSMSAFKKSRTIDEPILIRIKNLKVHQAEEVGKNEMYGYDYTGVLAQDNKISPYRLNYFGKSDKLIEGKYFDAVVLPLGYSTYETVDGGNEWAFTGWIVSIE